MTDLDDLFKPENKFIVPVTIHLSPTDELKLQKFINLHYLGDVDANELVNGKFRPKYPEKETEEFKTAVHNIFMGYTAYIEVEFNEKGIPTFGVVK